MAQFHGAKCRFLFKISLTTTYFLVGIIAGYITNSMALVADSFYMLSGVVALVIAYVSVLMSRKKWSKNTFGWARAEVLAALINSVLLCALCFPILIEALNRFYEPEDIHQPFLLLAVGSVGFVVNIIGLLLFKGHGHSHGVESESHSESTTPRPPVGQTSSQMNMHGVFLHVLAEALGSVIVIISALIIAFTNWEYSRYVDPTLSLILVFIIVRSTWPLLVKSAMILLQTVPTHIQVESLQKKLLDNIDGVLAVHEFHIWQLVSDRIIASAHFRCRNLTDYMLIAERVKEFFHNEGIHSTTLQPEFVELAGDKMDGVGSANCFLNCPTEQRNNCLAQTCCPQNTVIQSRDASHTDSAVITLEINGVKL